MYWCLEVNICYLRFLCSQEYPLKQNVWPFLLRISQEWLRPKLDSSGKWCKMCDGVHTYRHNAVQSPYNSNSSVHRFLTQVDVHLSAVKWTCYFAWVLHSAWNGPSSQLCASLRVLLDGFYGGTWSIPHPFYCDRWQVLRLADNPAEPSAYCKTALSYTPCMYIGVTMLLAVCVKESVSTHAVYDMWKWCVGCWCMYSTRNLHLIHHRNVSSY